MTQRNATLPDLQPDGASDRRWVVIGEDGRYLTLGRAVDPTEDELRDVERQLAAQRIGGWLAVMSSSPYGPVMPSLMMVRPLASPSRPWDAAEQACHALITAQRTAA
jgi:hypothetical protein